MSPLPGGARPSLALLVQLLRTRMTTISAITFLAAYLLPGAPVAPTPFLLSYAFVLCTQFATHALGDAADLRSDALNAAATPITGGSRALLRRRGAGSDAPPPLSPGAARTVGHALAAVSAGLAAAAVPRPARPAAAAILFLAYAYGAPPLLLNHRGAGEVAAAVVTNVLLPVYAATCAVAASGGGGERGVVGVVRSTPGLLLLVVPSFFVKVATFLVLNLADRRPDFAAGKNTLAVKLGDKTVATLVAGLHIAAYGAVLALPIALTWTSARATPAVTVVLLVTSLYGRHRVVQPLLLLPYKLDAILAPTLFHSMLLVWPILMHVLASRLLSGVSALASVEVVFTFYFLQVTVTSVMRGRRAAAAAAASAAALALSASKRGVSKPSNAVGNKRCNRGAAASPSISRNEKHFKSGASCLNGRDKDDVPVPGCHTPAASASHAAMEAGDPDVVVIGAGVAGVVTAATLQRLGHTVVVLERRGEADAEQGADLALWPGAVKVMRQLGVEDAWFERWCYWIDKVEMCNMEFDGERRADVMKTIDMRKVVDGTGERFCLVPRQPLMECLRGIVASETIVYDAEVTRVVESEELESATVQFTNGNGMERSVSARVAVGADGARSSMRRKVVDQAGGSTVVNFCGEVCYRGVVSLNDRDASLDVTAMRALFPTEAHDRTMRINYGAGLRSSFGYLSNPDEKEVAYWWVKQKVDSMPEWRGKMAHCPWPEPLRSLHDLTPDDCFYVHAIEDSDILPKWSSTRIVLVGDAAHAVTPNMGQGACMAIEDGFVLASQLARFWGERDGHLEAFYNFERARKPSATAVKSEARKQLVLGQLRHPMAVRGRDLLLRSMPAHVLEKKLHRQHFDIFPALKIFQEARIR